jgi:hypothetical protein
MDVVGRNVCNQIKRVFNDFRAVSDFSAPGAGCVVRVCDDKMKNLKRAKAGVPSEQEETSQKTWYQSNKEGGLRASCDSSAVKGTLDRRPLTAVKV